MPVIATPGAAGPNASTPSYPSNAFAITPADADTFASAVSVYVGGAGNVRCVPAGGSSPVTFVGLAAGQMLPVRVTAVYNTSTTATNLMAVY